QRAWLVDEVPAFVGDAEALVAVGAIAEALRRRAGKCARKVEVTWRRVDRARLVAATFRELEREPGTHAGRRAAWRSTCSGTAAARVPSKPDRERRLTPRGRARMRLAAVGLRALVGRVDTVLTSPYPRAAETAAIAAAALAKPIKPRDLDALAPDASPLEAL